MQKYLITFLSSIICINSYTNQHQIDYEMLKRKEFAQLQGSCIIKIVKEKLLYANKNKDLDIHQLTTTLQKLYEECSSVINGPGESQLTESDWIKKTIQEIFILQKDPETKNCLGQAVIQLKEIEQTSNLDKKYKIIQKFFENLDTCISQFNHKISLSDLNATIERWEQDKIKEACDTTLWSIILKNIPTEQDTLAQDLQKAYTACPLSPKIPFDESLQNIQSLIKKIENNEESRQCLENLLNFKKAYQATQTEEERTELKNNFAIPYMQCKNK